MLNINPMDEEYCLFCNEWYTPHIGCRCDKSGLKFGRPIVPALPGPVYLPLPSPKRCEARLKPGINTQSKAIVLEGVEAYCPFCASEFFVVKGETLCPKCTAPLEAKTTVPKFKPFGCGCSAHLGASCDA